MGARRLTEHCNARPIIIAGLRRAKAGVIEAARRADSAPRTIMARHAINQLGLQPTDPAKLYAPYRLSITPGAKRYVFGV